MRPGPPLGSSWSRLSLTGKLTLLTQAALLLTFLGLHGWISRQIQAQVLAAAEARATASADGVINGMNMLMVTGVISDPDLRRLYVRKMAASSGIEQLRIIRAEQVQRQFGPGVPDEQARDDLDRAALRTGLAQSVLDAGGSPPTLRLVVPFLVSRNFRGTDCLQCHHVEVGSVNGAASVTLDLSEDFRTIARIDRAIWGGQLGLQLLLAVVVAATTRGVLRPLRALKTHMKDMPTSGDLEAWAHNSALLPRSNEREVRELGATFHAMALALLKQIQALDKARELQSRYLSESLDEHARITALLSTMEIGVLFVSEDNRVIHANPAFCRIWRLAPPVRLAGGAALEILADAARRITSGPADALQVGPQGFGELPRAEVTLDDGSIVRISRHAVHGQNTRSGGRLWIFEDISDDYRTAQRLTYLAERDPLTGQLNRWRFQQDLTQALAAAGRSKSRVAVLLFDLDRFKYVNDNFGHGAGDEILGKVASEVSALVRRNEGFYRLGGDEFAILVAQATTEDVDVLAHRLVQAVGRIQFERQSWTLRMTASVGIALFPDHGAGVDELVAHADAAMYLAKEAGGNGLCFYNASCDVSKEMLSRKSLDDSIEQALQGDGLRLHFQGVYRIDGALSHLEALVRMVDPEDAERLLPPSTFIPAAERTGRILEIDQWALRTAIGTLSRSAERLAIAVNISGRSIRDDRLAPFILEELARRQVDPRRLLLELTETAAVMHLQHLRDFTQTMRRAGCRICLDDFGSGFSSFAYLRLVDADVLKIDGTFIQGLPGDLQNQVFVRAVVAVARALNKTTIAEHVEDAWTLELLKTMGVDMVQGCFFDSPVERHPALQPLA